MWPRDRDSNPRYAINVCQFSRLVHSTALPSLDLFVHSTIKKGGLSTPRGKNGWGGRIRTFDDGIKTRCLNHLATPQTLLS